MVFKFLLILLVSAFPLSLKASKIYHVDTSVDLSAFISGLKQITNDSIIVNLSEGTYFLKKTIRFNVEYRVPIKIVGHGRVIISGSEPLAEWIEVPNGLWRTKQIVNYDVRQLNVNGILAVRARTPNTGVSYLKGGTVDFKDGDEVGYSVLLPNDFDTEIKAIKVNESPIINLLRLFTHSKAIVTSVNKEKNSLTFKERFTHSYFTPNNLTGVFLENYFAALDSPGEWYQDGEGYIYYMPREGERINDITIAYAKLSKLVSISGTANNLAGNISFKDVVFEGCDVVGSESGIPPYQSAYTLDAAISAIYAHNININDCEFRGLGGNAIWMMDKCEDCTINNNYIHDIGGGGVKIGGLNISHEYVSQNILVNNNIINRFGRVYLGATGIFLTYAHHCNISHNDISDAYYSGISAGFSWGYGKSPTHDNIISYNKITNLGHGLLKGFAGIYTLGVSPGTIIKNNYISEIKSKGSGGFGIYTDEGSSEILIENNVTYNCSGSFHQHYGSNNVVRNNIFAFGKEDNLLFSIIRKPEDLQLTLKKNIVLVSNGDVISGEAINNGSFYINENCLYNVNGKELTVNGKSLESWLKKKNFSFVTDNPKFKGPERGDFRLSSKRVTKVIGFKPIDLSKVGADWRP